MCYSVIGSHIKPVADRVVAAGSLCEPSFWWVNICMVSVCFLYLPGMFTYRDGGTSPILHTIIFEQSKNNFNMHKIFFSFYEE